MRFFKRFGILLGSLHIILYFIVPDYFSLMDKVVPMVIGLPAMFAFGYFWPLLVFFAFAPRRFYNEPETQRFISEFGRRFGLQVTTLSMRVISLILLWPFTFANFVFPYLILKILNAKS